MLQIFLLSLLASACNSGDEKLDLKLRKEADSIFAARVEVIGPQIDSMCSTIKDSMIQVRYDSIVELRKKRIHELSR